MGVGKCLPDWPGIGFVLPEAVGLGSGGAESCPELGAPLVLTRRPSSKGNTCHSEPTDPVILSSPLHGARTSRGPVFGRQGDNRTKETWPCPGVARTLSMAHR